MENDWNFEKLIKWFLTDTHPIYKINVEEMYLKLGTGNDVLQ